MWAPPSGQENVRRWLKWVSAVNKDSWRRSKEIETERGEENGEQKAKGKLKLDEKNIFSSCILFLYFPSLVSPFTFLSFNLSINTFLKSKYIRAESWKNRFYDHRSLRECHNFFFSNFISYLLYLSLFHHFFPVLHSVLFCFTTKRTKNAQK